MNKEGFKINDVLHEVFYPGFNILFYPLTQNLYEFKLLQLLTKKLPSQCSDFYFVCKLRRDE